MDAPEPVLRVRSMSVRYGGLKALDRVSLDVEEQAVTALIGPNGAGKSTLLNAVSGFCPLSAGTVTMRGRDVSGIPAHHAVRTGMARSFQDLEVMQQLTVAENVLLGFRGQPSERLWRLLLTPRRVRRAHRETVRATLEILAQVGLLERADTLASELSYGEQKLLTVARLMATDAELLMLDEPGAGLPTENLHQIGTLLRDMVARGRSVLLVDHNMDLVMAYADRVTVLHHGQVIASGAPEAIRADPRVVDVYFARGERSAPVPASDDGGGDGAA